MLNHITVYVSIDGAAAADATLQTIDDAIDAGKEVSLGTQVTAAATSDTITVPVNWKYNFDGTGTYDADDTAAASGTTLPTVTLTFTGINTQID